MRGSVEDDPIGSGDSSMTSQPSSPAVPALSAITNALTDLGDLDELPTAAHVARLRAVHDALTEALSSIDEI